MTPEMTLLVERLGTQLAGVVMDYLHNKKNLAELLILEALGNDTILSEIVAQMDDEEASRKLKP